MLPRSQLSTHTVMPMGAQARMPAMRYFFMGAQSAALLLEGAAGAGAGAGVDAGVALGAAGADDASAAGALAAPEPPRKSVTYQPEPLSWKPAAVTCLAKADWPHCGQTVSTGSEIF